MSNSFISLSLLSASSLNIYFCFEIHGLSLSSKAYFLIVLTYPWSWIDFICFSHWSSVVFICFSKAFPKGEWVNFVCSIICYWLDCNISSPVRYSYLRRFPDDLADISATFLLISYRHFSSLIWLLIVILIIYYRGFF